MMNNGQNPYGNYYNPYYPVMPNQLPVNQMQQTMQRPNVTGMGGRVVNNENEITPNELSRKPDQTLPHSCISCLQPLGG